LSLTRDAMIATFGLSNRDEPAIDKSPVNLIRIMTRQAISKLYRDLQGIYQWRAHRGWIVQK
jgi:hypothetical protein